MFSRSLSVCLLLAAVLPLSLTAQTPLPHREADRVTTAIDPQNRRALHGHKPAWATAADDLGAVNADVALDHLTVVLARSAATQAAFEQLLDDQQNPASPRYHQWLTPQQVGTEFGPTAHDVDAVTQWLTSQGLRVDAVSPDSTRITFSGASGSVGRALNTEFHRYRVRTRKGEESFLSVANEPAVPAALGEVIAAFHGLAEEDLEPQSRYENVTTPAHALGSAAGSLSPELTTSSGSHYVAPADFVTIFDMQPAYTAGINGSGVKVAIIGESRVLASDITSFQTNTGLSATAQPVTIIPTTGTDPGYASSSGNEGEQTLDVNRVMGTAPGAEADLVVSGGSSGLTIAMQYEVNTLKDPIMTISYGACEASSGSSAVTFYNNLFSTAASEGITTFVSSGDDAAAGCTASFSTPPQTTPVLNINALCSSSYVTCVGGTEFADTASPSTYWKSTNGTGFSSALSYIPEGAWNEPLTSSNNYQIAGTGGGASVFITKPSWQTGIGVPTDGARDTPDVALPSAGHDGYYACLSGSCSSGGFTVFSGTSAAAPGMAGIMALVVQKLGTPQGNFNPTIYRVAASIALGAFHDTTPASSGVSSCSVNTASMCNNSTPSSSALTGGLAGYALTTGYDEATGWGSVDVEKLITAVSAGFTIGTGTTFAVTAGSSGTSNIVVTSQNSFAGTVTLTCIITTSPSSAANIAPTCLAAPSSVTLTSGSSSTVVITVNTTVRHAVAGTSTAGFARLGVLTLLLLLTLPALPLAGRKRLPILAMLLAGAMATLNGCGGSSSAAAVANGTNAGTYVATVTGTSGSTTSTGTVTFTVN